MYLKVAIKTSVYSEYILPTSILLEDPHSGHFIPPHSGQYFVSHPRSRQTLTTLWFEKNDLLTVWPHLGHARYDSMTNPSDTIFAN